MYSLTQAQYNQLINFSKQAQEVQKILESLKLVETNDFVEQDKLFDQLRMKPYQGKVNLCVPLVKQWDKILQNDSSYLTNMKLIFREVFGMDDWDNIQKIFEILKESGACIAGSAALACLNRCSPDFNPGDIDIFFPATEKGTQGLKDIMKLLYIHPAFLCLSGDSINEALGDFLTEKIDELNVYKMNLDIQLISTITFRCKGKIQLIQLKEDRHTTLRSFFRSFDLSCCQVYFDGTDFYVRSIYRDLTLNKFNLILKKELLVPSGSKLGERIDKYIDRGFKTYTYDFELHKGNEKVRDGLKIEFDIKGLEKQIQDFFDGTKSEDEIDKYHIGLETVSMLLYYWCQLVKRFNDVPKISPIIKKQLLWQLGIALQVKDIPLNILKGVFELLFELQDIRWLLLFLSEHPCMTTFFTTENLKKAAQCNFARDNLQIFKNKVNNIIHEL